MKNVNFHLKSLNLIRAELGMLYQTYQHSNYFSLMKQKDGKQQEYTSVKFL